MKFKPGFGAGELSGSLGATVASHSRYGPYFRTRVVPVNPATTPQNTVRNNFAAASAFWKQLTDTERNTWKAYAQTRPIIDRLGASQVLTGNAIAVRINARRMLGGNPLLRVPNISSNPDSLTAMSITADIGTGACAITFTPTPLAAGKALAIYAAVLDSPGKSYIKNLFKFLCFTGAAQASPYDYQADIEAKFGTLAVGQIVVLNVHVYLVAAALLSTTMQARATVISTP